MNRFFKYNLFTYLHETYLHECYFLMVLILYGEQDLLNNMYKQKKFIVNNY